MNKIIVTHTYRFPNNNVATFNCAGEQIPELQGVYSEELYNKIKEHSNQDTIWNGF